MRQDYFLKTFIWISVFFICLITNSAFAEQVPQSLSADHRIKEVNYDPNNVTLIKAHYGYETQITFSPDETVDNVAIGDSLAWQAVPVANHLFIKPVATSTTNMTVLTNLRSYHFELNSSNSKNPKDQIYALSFVYPEAAPIGQTALSHALAAPSSVYYNGEYAFTGNPSIVPIQAFDDGQFTYFKFRSEGDSTIPAIFVMDKDRQETLVNYHVANGYVVINRVANQYTLRSGNNVASVYNDKAIGDWSAVK